MEDCPPVTNLEQALDDEYFQILPIRGLRRNADGILTPDAINTVIDGLKSKAINLIDEKERKRIIKELVAGLCTIKRQYDFLMKEFVARLDRGMSMDNEFMEAIRERNVLLMDILTVARHVDTLKPASGLTNFIEGWQNSLPAGPDQQPAMPPAAKKLLEQFQIEGQMLASKSYEEMRKHRIQILTEKNKTASNYLGIYGFMNLVAVGLLIYISSAGSS